MIKVLIPIIYATILFMLPRRLVQKTRRKLADFIFFQWSKMSLASAIIYALFMENGNGNSDADDLGPYLDRWGDTDNQ